MTSQESGENARSHRSKHRGGAALAMVLTFAAIWFVFGRVHDPALIGYAQDSVTWVRTNLSIFRATLIVGFGGSLLSIPFLRRRQADPVEVATLVENKPSPPSPDVHPLLLVPRPARDSRFVIRKTRKSGRIRRNRAGERLPASSTSD